MTIALESMAVEMPEVEGHPNREAFRGVLTLVNVPSQRPPSGSRGRRVLLTREAAEAAIPSLMGMALDYAPSFDRHDVRRKVGVITQADIVGRELQISGFLYARDFPEIVAEIAKSGRKVRPGLAASSVRASRQARNWRAGTEGQRLRSSLSAAVEKILGLKAAKQSAGERYSLHAAVETTLRAEAPSTGVVTGLGMSYEVTNVQLVDARAKVWILTHVTFTGAAILRRDKAAYQDTWIGLG